MTEYYIKATGGSDSNNGLTLGQAWDSFPKAMTVLSAGDTLWLDDGEYKGSSRMMVVTISGSIGSPITFKAINDGQAKIDAETTASRVPFKMEGVDVDNHLKYITVEGIKFTNGDIAPLVKVTDADNVIFKKCSGIDPAATSINAIFQIWKCNDILIEDCFASGPARKCFMMQHTDDSVMRRCVGLFHSEPSGDQGGVAFNLYGTNNCIVENCIHLPAPGATQTCDWPLLINGSSAPAKGFDNSIYGSYTSGGEIGLGMHSQDYFTMTGNLIKDCVSLSPLNTGGSSASGARLRDQSSGLYNKNTMVLTEDWTPSYAVRCDVVIGSDPGWANGTIKNCSLLSSTGKIGFSISGDSRMGTINHTYNNLYGFDTPYSGTTAGTGEIAVDPEYNTATYGNGAYLMVPTALQGVGEGGEDIGAEILYKYTDGVLDTSGSVESRLWPWNLEDRIFNETGVSVTWSIWDTLDGVYSENILTISAPAKDGYLRSSEASTNHGTEVFSTIRHSGGSTDIARGVYAMDFSALPDNVTILSAIFSLYNYTQTGTPGDGYVNKVAYVRRMIRTNWVENEFNWNYFQLPYEAGNGWSTAGGDYTTDDEAFAPLTGTFTWQDYNITNIAKYAQQYTNKIAYLIHMYDEDTGTSNMPWFRTREELTNVNQIAKLVITFADGINRNSKVFGGAFAGPYVGPVY